MDASQQWRLHKGVLFLTEVITTITFKVEAMKNAADHAADYDVLLARLYDGVREARVLVPCLVACADATFEGRQQLCTGPSGVASYLELCGRALVMPVARPHISTHCRQPMHCALVPTTELIKLVASSRYPCASGGKHMVPPPACQGEGPLVSAGEASYRAHLPRG